MPLPTTATAPFCPAEVQGSVAIDLTASRRLQWWRFAGPGLLVAIGYIDPGNWATDIEAGSRFGYALLWVVACSSLGAMLLQLLAARLGLVTGQDLAQLSRARSGRRVWPWQWFSAQLAIVATDLAEVLGCALAFHLLLDVPLLWGVALTVLDTLIVLGLQGRGFRRLEAIVVGLLATVLVCFAVQLLWSPPDAAALMAGLVPQWPGSDAAARQDALVLALGIVGATIMPHNLYLHTSIVQTRRVEVGSGPDAPSADTVMQRLLSLARLDTVVSLSVAMLINGAILVVAASAFHGAGLVVDDISRAHELLAPVAGGAAAFLFGLALLASGQSSTITGTIAAQVILDGFLHLKVPCYVVRLVTRALSLVPAALGILWLGDGAVGTLLVWSQVVLSLQLPLAMWPLIRMCSDPQLMGRWRIGAVHRAVAWLLFGLIVVANLVLLVGLLKG